MDKVIDGHLHISREKSEKECLQYLLALGGLEGIGIASMPLGIGYDSMHANERALKLKRESPGRIFVFGGLDYSDSGYRSGTVDFAQQAEALFAAGVDGIKMIEGKPDARKSLGIPLDSPIFDSFYSYMEQNARPILLHVADPASFWDREKISDWAMKAGWFWGEGDYPSMKQLYAEAGGVLKKFPSLKITFAHFYFLWEDPASIGAFLDRWANVCVDLTPGTPMYYSFAAAPERWKPVFERYQERLIFGTDNVGTCTGDKQKHLEASLARMNQVRKFLETDEPVFGGRGLQLDAGVLKKIYRDNFMRAITPEKGASGFVGGTSTR